MHLQLQCVMEWMSPIGHLLVEVLTMYFLAIWLTISTLYFCQCKPFSFSGIFLEFTAQWCLCEECWELSHFSWPYLDKQSSLHHHVSVVEWSALSSASPLQVLLDFVHCSHIFLGLTLINSLRCITKFIKCGGVKRLCHVLHHCRYFLPDSKIMTKLLEIN